VLPTQVVEQCETSFLNRSDSGMPTKQPKPMISSQLLQTSDSNVWISQLKATDATRY